MTLKTKNGLLSILTISPCIAGSVCKDDESTKQTEKYSWVTSAISPNGTLTICDLKTGNDGQPIKNVLTILFFFIFALPAIAQNEIRFERITVENGLSQSSITSLIQDKFGYLWVGTLDGLNKYDGSKFKIYKHADSDLNSIPKSDINRLFLDNSQNLWVATNGSLSRHIPEKDNFKNFIFQVNGEVKSDFFISDFDQVSDSLILLSSNYGVWQFNPLTGQSSRKPELAYFNDVSLNSYCADTNQDIWITTRNKIYLRKKGEIKFTLLLEDRENIVFNYSKNPEEIHVLTRERLYKFDRTSGIFKTLLSFSVNEDVDVYSMRLLKMTNGNIWVMRRAIFILDSSGKIKKTLKYISQNPLSLSTDYLSCIFETKDGVVWVGTNGLGLNKYSPRLSVFNYYGNFPGAPISLSHNYVTSAFSYDDNQIFVSTLEGLDVINLKLNKTEHFEILAKNGRKARINKFLGKHEDELWIATSGGLRKWNGKDVQFTDIPLLDDSNIIINDLLFLDSDKILMATNAHFILLNTHTNIVSVASTESILLATYINDLLWTEFNAHIKQLNTRDFSVIHEFKNDPNDSSSFPAQLIKCFYQDLEGRVWVGTTGGLLLYDSAQLNFTLFNERQGLPNSVIYGILEDKAGNLWLSTNNGLSVFSKTKLRSIRNFNSSHGLQGNEFNTNAFYKSPSGKMYFGGVGGLTAFRPEEALNLGNEIPEGIITGLYINGVKKVQTENNQTLGQIAKGGQMNLTWAERNFGFEISSLGFFVSSIYFLSVYARKF